MHRLVTSPADRYAVAAALLAAMAAEKGEVKVGLEVKMGGAVDDLEDASLLALARLLDDVVSSVCLSVGLSVCRSVGLSVCLSVFIRAYMHMYVRVRMYVCVCLCM